MEEKIETMFPVYFKKSELKEINKAAKKENRSASNYIRNAAMEKTRR